MLAYNPLYYKTFLTRNIYITSGRRALLTLRSLNIGFTFQKVKSTHLCLPLSMTIAKRFGGNKKGSGLGGKMGNVGKGTPLKPSSLAKPLPPQPKPMSPKHMPILFRKNDQNWYSLGYLTSQPQFKKLGNMQFKAFQDINYRELIPKNPDKPQYLALYDNAKKVPEDQIILLKGGADYLAFIKQTEIINKICEKLMEKAYVNYNPEGLTVEQCIATCIHFDTVVKKNLSHPQTNADILNSAQMAAKKNKIKPVTDETLPE